MDNSFVFLWELRGFGCLIGASVHLYINFLPQRSQSNSHIGNPKEQPTNGLKLNTHKRRKIINTLRLLCLLSFPVYRNYELIIFISQTGRYAIGLPLRCHP